MRSMLLAGPVVLLSLGATGAYGQLTSNVLNAGQVPDDRRLTDVRTLNSYHPWTPYESVGDGPHDRLQLPPAWLTASCPSPSMRCVRPRRGYRVDSEFEAKEN